MSDNHAFLDNLAGSWDLTGEMGDVGLHQQVRAEWTLGGKFLWMYFKSLTGEGNPTSDYEAVYHIAYNEKHQIFVMHLLDTTDIPLNCVMGTGTRQANDLPFLFEYGQTRFWNRFAWHPDTDSWSFIQSFEEAGETKLFATKVMVRAPV